jgi:hypothetical protein
MTLHRQNFQEKVALWQKNSVSVTHNAKTTFRSIGDEKHLFVEDYQKNRVFLLNLPKKKADKNSQKIGVVLLVFSISLKFNEHFY